MMKRLLFPCLILMLLSPLSVFPIKESEVITLHDNWEFSQANRNIWREAKVPGTVHQDLLRHQLIEDPFYGKNEEKVQWVEKEDWQYRTTFTVTQEQLQRHAALLRFDGLDTYANIYLNGALLKRTDNMFMAYEMEVKDFLREGENQLFIHFNSPITFTLPQWQTDGFEYPADNDHGTPRLSAYTRKAPYSYGWDWGIRLTTSGVWRPVTLTFYDMARIEDVYVRQEEVNEQQVSAQVQIQVQGVQDKPQEAEMFLTLTYKEEVALKEQRTITLEPNENTYTLPIQIEKPHLWMPNGWGEAALYTLSVEIKAQGKTVASDSQRIGFRTVEFIMEDDEWGRCFYFKVNGKSLFAKGSNYIPSDALLPQVTPERYRQMMHDAQLANHNMIRVWGGGIYEDECFYEAADEMGLLVWQDFMFACTTYPSDPTFLQRVKEEAIYNIKRLRNHACLALWCGNNEIYEGMRYWGWKKRYTPQTWNAMQKGYDKLFHQLLPEMVKEYNPDKSYIHTSPLIANWGHVEDMPYADSHHWAIWHGKRPFESLDKEIPRFMSEYGYQAFPEMKTIATFASPEDYALESDVMNAHQKATIGNALIQQTMERYFPMPNKDFEELVYKSMVLQGFGIRWAIESHRRNRPYCMGNLYWQLNDSWPVVSWSGIDYYGNWKALHYQTQRAFAPLLLHAYKDSTNRLGIYALSDKLEEYPTTSLDLKVMDFDGKILKRKQVNCQVEANATSLLFEDDYKDWAIDPSCTLLHMTLKDKKGVTLAHGIYYFCYPKDQKLPKANIQYRVKQMDGTCEIMLSSKQLARDVFIEIPYQGARYTDNFFDLLPGEKKKIVVTHPQFGKDKPLEFKIRHMNGIIK